MESKETKIVWITMLAMANKTGEVDAAIPGLAKMAGVSVAECQQAVQVLMAPDSFSRTKEHEGRRIVALPDGGWVILNHSKYRAKMGQDERRVYLAKKQSERRARIKAEKLQKEGQKPASDPKSVNLASTGVAQKSTVSTHAEADTEADTDPLSQSPVPAAPEGAKEEPPPPKKREPNLLLEALATVDGSRVDQIPNKQWPFLQKLLTEIKEVLPTVTPAEISRRASNYRLHFPILTLTPSALVKYWGMCEHSPKLAGSRQAEIPLVPTNLR